MQKIVIDTNELIFSILSEKSYSAEIMEKVYCENVELYISEGILDEYARVLAYEKFNFTVERREQTLRDIREVGRFVNPLQSSVPIRDEDDRIFYDTAKQSGAILITSDNDLLVLNENFIMSAEEYMKISRTTFLS